MINFENFMFAYLSSSFVMRDINPKNSKKTWLQSCSSVSLGQHCTIMLYPLIVQPLAPYMVLVLHIFTTL